jgi:hypothetical protein
MLAWATPTPLFCTGEQTMNHTGRGEIVDSGAFWRRPVLSIPSCQNRRSGTFAASKDQGLWGIKQDLKYHWISDKKVIVLSETVNLLKF